MKTGTIILSAILTVGMISCKKNVDSVSSSNSGLDFQLRATSPSSIVARTTATITWESGFVNANMIKFEAKQNGQETEFKSNVQKHVDLFGTLSTIGTINLPTGTFDEVEFKIEAAPNGNEPAFQLQGTVNGVPVMVKVDNALEIKSEQSQVTLSGADIALNTITLSQLTDGLSAADFTNATQTNGVIVISSSSNKNLFDAIVANFRTHHETEVEVHHRH
jgi:hypothetical protein